MAQRTDDYHPKGVKPEPEVCRYVGNLIRTIGPIRTARRLGLTKTTVMALALGLVVHRGSVLAVYDVMRREAA